MRTTNYQFHLLVEYMEKYGDITKIPFTPAGRERTLRHWNELTEILNSNGSIGPIRTSYQWRKVWADFKNTTRRKAARGNSTPNVQRRPFKVSLENRVLALGSPKQLPSDYSGDTNKINENASKILDIDNLDDMKHNSDTLYLSDSDEEDDSSDDEPLALKKDYSIQNYSDSPDNLTIISNPDENTPPINDSTEKNNQVQDPIKDALIRHINNQDKDVLKQNDTLPQKNIAKLPMSTKDNRVKTPTPWPVKETNIALNPENDLAFNIKEGLAKHIQDMKGDTRYNKLMEAIGKDPKQMGNLKDKIYNKNENDTVVKPKKKRRSVVKCIAIDEYKRDTVNQPVQISVSKNNLKPVPIEKLKSFMVNNIPSTVTSRSATQNHSISVSEVNKETRNIQNVVENNNPTKDLPKTNSNLEIKAPENKTNENTPMPINLNANTSTNQNATVNVPAPNTYTANVPNPPITRKRTRTSYANHEMFRYQREIELIRLEIEREKIKMRNRCISLIENLLRTGENK